MQRRYNLTHLILASVIVLGLTLLMVCVDAQAQIAFVSDRDGNREIYVMDVNGKNRHRLTNNRHGDWSPSWSPDGKRIAFTSERDGNDEIYVMDADGGNQQNLTNHPGRDSVPSWSPDGKRIAFVSDRDGHVIDGRPTDEIYVMDADGGNQQNLTNNPDEDWTPSWSPDGKRIAFMSGRDREKDNPHNFEIYVMDADGGNQQNLTNNRVDDSSPSWSPDGKRIVFSSIREGHFERDFGITDEIYVMDADGGNQQRLTNNRQYDWSPSWSPDGERIAFSSDRKGDLQNFEIYVMDADGGNQQRLTNNRADDSSPSWSPDSGRIAFVSGRDADRNSEIYVMDADGGNQRRLTNNRGWDVSPAWLNSPFSVSLAGKKFTMWGRLKQVDR